MSSIPLQFEQHIDVVEENILAVDLLSSATNLSKQRIKQVMQKGAVWLSRGKYTQRLRRASKTLRLGEAIHIYYDQGVLSALPPKATLVSDEGHYSIWNKPCGMLSQGSKWGDHCTITRFAEQHLKPQRAGFVVHRLDRAAQGLILVAHEKKAAAALSKLFQQRLVQKRYQVWVHGDFSAQDLSLKQVTVNQDIDGRRAVSYFTMLGYDAEKNQSQLDVSIETGRKHQIRRHIASLGFPVVGDRLHGSGKDDADLQLFAYHLSFECPFSHIQKSYDIGFEQSGSG